MITLLGDAASCSNGFPSRLVYGVEFPTGPSTRLIPEMNFTCNGVIVGYTAALKEYAGMENPVIQVWRENSSQRGVYYTDTSTRIAIDRTLCEGGSTDLSGEVFTFHCHLSEAITRVFVHPGDFLGLKLPQEGTDDVRLAFARVSNGPTNHVFTAPIMLNSVPGSRNQELPQITLEINSSQSIFNNLV